MALPRTHVKLPPLSRPSPGNSRFEQLPAELLAAIFEFLPPSTLRYMCLVSRITYEYASTVLWRDLELVDCERAHSIPDGFTCHPSRSPHKVTLNGTRLQYAGGAVTEFA
jgi:hypothetical protein